VGNDHLPAFYPLLTLISIAGFAWLARRMALVRNRNVWGWTVAGAVLPPLLAILYLMKPLAADPPGGEGDDARDGIAAAKAGAIPPPERR
jgi:hypothetical protein